MEKNIASLSDRQNETDQKNKKKPSGYRGTTAHDSYVYTERIKLWPLVNATFRHCPLMLKFRLL